MLQTLRSPDLKEVRGKGLWIGIELLSPARPYCEALKDVGILCKETHDRVIRIAPPLSLRARKLTGLSGGFGGWWKAARARRKEHAEE